MRKNQKMFHIKVNVALTDICDISDDLNSSNIPVISTSNEYTAKIEQ